MLSQKHGKTRKGDRKVILVKLLRDAKRPLSEVARQCRAIEGGEGITQPVLSEYLRGRRPISERHFLILCAVARVSPRSVKVKVTTRLVSVRASY